MIQADNQTMLIFEFVGIIFISILGTALHFTFAWSRRNRVVGIFSAVNESIWEHMKMAFWPLLFYTGIEYVLLIGKSTNILFGNMISVLVTLSIIPIVVCTYTCLIKRNILAVDVSTFVVAIIIGQLVSFRLFNYNTVHPAFNIIGLCMMVGLAAAFTLFTFHPPHVSIFKDSVTGKYGLSKR